MELDLEVLTTFKRRPGIRSVAEIAEALGCTEDDARRRLSDLEASGYLWGPIYGWDPGTDNWAEAGYGLRDRGRDVLAGGVNLP
jgi:DNA-binding IclR family transcriptional regulator